MGICLLVLSFTSSCYTCSLVGSVCIIINWCTLCWLHLLLYQLIRFALVLVVLSCMIQFFKGWLHLRAYPICTCFSTFRRCTQYERIRTWFAHQQLLFMLWSGRTALVLPGAILRFSKTLLYLFGVCSQIALRRRAYPKTVATAFALNLGSPSTA